MLNEVSLNSARLVLVMTSVPQVGKKNNNFSFRVAGVVLVDYLF